MAGRRVHVLVLLLLLRLADAAASAASTAAAPAGACSRKGLHKRSGSTSAIPLRKTTAAVMPATLRGGGAKAEQERRISIWFPILAAYLYNLSIGFSIPILPKVRPKSIDFDVHSNIQSINSIESIHQTADTSPPAFSCTGRQHAHQ